MESGLWNSYMIARTSAGRNKVWKVAKYEWRSIQYIVEEDQLVTWASAVSPTLVVKTENCVYIVRAYFVYTFCNISTLHIGSYVATLSSLMACLVSPISAIALQSPTQGS